MKINDKEQITNIVNAFRLINKDMRILFDIMSNKLESENGFVKWKKWEKGNKNAKEDYADYTSFFDGDDWYYLNCYGLCKDKVIGFTFVISINYEDDDKDYADFLKQLDEKINLNTPMLCIFGIYSPIDLENITLINKDGWQYVDDILQFTDSWNDYKKENIKYNKWHDIEINYRKDNDVIEEYKGWYKNSKIRINNITDISSKEKAEKYIDELLNELE